MKFHAVMIGECGEEFGVTLEADEIADARASLEDDYPESRIDELKSVAAWDRKQQEMEEFIYNGGDWDDEGRPFYHY